MKRESRNSRIAREIHRPQAAREARKVNFTNPRRDRSEGRWKLERARDNGSQRRVRRWGIFNQVPARLQSYYRFLENLLMFSGRSRTNCKCKVVRFASLITCQCSGCFFNFNLQEIDWITDLFGLKKRLFFRISANNSEMMILTSSLHRNNLFIFFLISIT